MTGLAAARRQAPASSARALAGSTTVVLVLGLIVAVATLVQAVLALASPSIWIVPDELIYAELAKSLGEGGLPAIRGDVSFAYGLAYPLLLAPLWAAFADVETTYAAAKLLNAFILSLAAIPAYFLARRFVDERAALVVAALTVSVPAMLYAGTLMTEVVLYPAVVLAILAIAAAIERPSPSTQAAVLGAIALASMVKAVALVLIPAYLAGCVLYHWLESCELGDFRERLRRYLPTGTVLGAFALVALAATMARGGRPHDVLGTYASVWKHMELADVPRWIVLHLAELDLAVAVIPLVATTLVVTHGFRREARRPERLFAALAAPALAAWLVAVGAFASVPFLEMFEYPENVQRLQGRSTFMLAPLLFVGLMLWLRERPGRLAPTVAATVVCVLLPLAIPLDDLDGNVRFQALSLVPLVDVRDEIPWQLAALGATAVLGAVAVLAAASRASSRVVVASVAFVLLAVVLLAQSSMRSTSVWSRSVGVGTTPDWIDAAVGQDAAVSVLWYEPPGKPFVDLEPRHRVLFVGEFFNRSVGDVYELGSPLPYALPATTVRLEGGRVVLADGSPVSFGDYVLAPCHVALAGEVVAREPWTGARLLRVRGPVVATASDPASCRGGSG